MSQYLKGKTMGDVVKGLESQLGKLKKSSIFDNVDYSKQGEIEFGVLEGNTHVLFSPEMSCDAIMAFLIHLSGEEIRRFEFQEMATRDDGTRLLTGMIQDDNPLYKKFGVVGFSLPLLKNVVKC